jgi:hypothetical protein
MRHAWSSKNLKRFRPGTGYLLRLCAIFIIFILTQLPCTAANVENKSDSDASKKTLVSEAEKKWGILPLSIQLTAAGQLLDYRYLVIDPDKALALMKRGDKAYLIDQASGIRITVPRTKVGPLRQTGTKPVAGKIYPILFANAGGVIKPGNKVTLVIGEFRMENIVVGKAISPRAGLTQAKRAKWDTIQKMIRKDRATCIEHCGQDQNCIAKCETAYKSRLNLEYQKLLKEK